MPMDAQARLLLGMLTVFSAASQAACPRSKGYPTLAHKIIVEYVLANVVLTGDHVPDRSYLRCR